MDDKAKFMEALAGQGYPTGVADVMWETEFNDEQKERILSAFSTPMQRTVTVEVVSEYLEEAKAAVDQQAEEIAAETAAEVQPPTEEPAEE